MEWLKIVLWKINNAYKYVILMFILKNSYFCKPISIWKVHINIVQTYIQHIQLECRINNSQESNNEAQRIGLMLCYWDTSADTSAYNFSLIKYIGVKSSTTCRTALSDRTTMTRFTITSINNVYIKTQLIVVMSSDAV